MERVKTVLIVILIVFMGFLNLYLEAVNKKAEYEVMKTLEEHQHEQLIYDEDDSTTWWYEGHTTNK